MYTPMEETKEKISNTLRGRERSDQHKENIRKSRVGKKVKQFLTKESAEKRRLSLLKYWADVKSGKIIRKKRNNNPEI